jgi:hypothetical protein
VGISGAGFLLRAGVALRLVVVRLVAVRFVVVRFVVVRLVLVRRRRPGMPLPLVPGTVSGDTDGTSDGIAG